MVYDFIVVGAGIAGASVAFELANHGSVCIIEAEGRPGTHATSRSAALFAPSYGGREIRAITRASRAFFDRPPPGFCEHPLLQKRGGMLIARQDQRGRLEQTVADIRSSGGNVTLIDEGKAMACVPILRSGYVAAAAVDFDVMDIEVHALLQGFMRGARADRAVLVTGNPVTGIEHRNGVWSVELSDGPVGAPVLINAAGAWADQLATACGAPTVGLVPMRRTALLVDVPAGVDIREWPAVLDVDEQFYFKPEAGKLLLSPADETPSSPGDAQPDELDIAIGVARVEAALDIDVRRVSHSWAGLRTFSPDRAPVIGFDVKVPGLFWCAGQGGYGIQTAPAMGRIAAALAMGKCLPEDVAAEGLTEGDLSPGRFTRRCCRSQLLP
jgi:D-arginine dehydrogenase